MTSNAIMRAVNKVTALRDPNPNLPAKLDELEDQIRDYIPHHNDPEALARDADDKIRRHITVSTMELRQEIDAMRMKTDELARMADNFVREAEDGAAEIMAQVRAHTDRLSVKIAALKGE